MGKISTSGDAASAHWSQGWRRLALLSVIGLLALLAPATTSSALDGVFESNDGNLVDGAPAAAGPDWNDFTFVPATATVPAHWTLTGFEDLTRIDDQTGNPDDIYNGGVKQDVNCPATKSGSLGGGGGKFDVSRIYLTHTEVGGEDYLFLAWVRVPQSSTTASSHIAFEFNGGEVACSDGKGLIERVAGDKLVVYDFEGGSADPTLKLATWITDDADGPCEVASNSAPCWALDTLPASAWDAKVNVETVGEVQDDIADETLGVVEFGEAGINLTDAVGEEDICAFSGHVTGVARSSGSAGTAQMKDKVGPAAFELPGCVAETTITSNISLDDHATINGFDSQGAGDGSGDLTFTLYGPEDTNCNGVVDDTEGDTDEAVDPVYETTVADVDSGGPHSTADGDSLDGDSYLVPTDAPGTYNWVVSYSGDDGHNSASASLCGDETAVVTYGAP